MIQKILVGKTQEEQSAFIKQVDKQRWTPLHCAAYFDCLKSAIMLLKVDRSIAGQNGLMPFSPKLYSLIPSFPN